VVERRGAECHEKREEWFLKLFPTLISAKFVHNSPPSPPHPPHSQPQPPYFISSVA